MTLTEFLLARIAEDEALARHMWEERVARRHVGLEVSHRWPTPDRVLAECEAKRRIVQLFVSADEHAKRHPDVPMLGLTAGAYESALRVLARPFADHPDFDPEWAA